MKIEEDEKMEAAPFALRATAFTIDSALLLVIHLTFFLLLGLALHRAVGLEGPGIVLLLLLFAAMPPFWFFLYFVYFHAYGGQTPGKMVMGLQVIESPGLTPTLGTSFLRWVGYLVSALPLAAGFIWMLIDREQRTWHDKLAGTRVVLR